MSQTCLMNQSSDIWLILDNSFELPDEYMAIDKTIKIEKLIEMSILKKYDTSMNIDVNTFTKTINNYIAEGITINLPNNEIIIGNNISIEIITNKLELSKLEKLFKESIKQTVYPNS